MRVSDALLARRTIRAFTDARMDEAQMRALLTRAARAPSGGNLQPWKVYVLGPSLRDELVARVGAKMAAGSAGDGAEYQIYPPNLPEPWRSRRFAVGEAMYATIGIPREEKAARLMQMAKNFTFFGAPQGLVFTMNRIMQQGQWADLGMYMQSVMLLALEMGWATAPQEAWANWSATIRDLLAVPDDEMIFCGMAIGKPDRDHPINSLHSERAPFAEWAVMGGY